MKVKKSKQVETAIGAFHICHSQFSDVFSSCKKSFASAGPRTSSWRRCWWRWSRPSRSGPSGSCWPYRSRRSSKGRRDVKTFFNAFPSRTSLFQNLWWTRRSRFFSVNVSPRNRTRYRRCPALPGQPEPFCPRLNRAGIGSKQSNPSGSKHYGVVSFHPKRLRASVSSVNHVCPGPTAQTRNL